jgi:hypothetical protein
VAIPTLTDTGYEQFSGDTWTCSTTLEVGEVYLVALWVAQEAFALEPPTLVNDSGDSLWWKTLDHEFTPSGAPFIHLNGAESNPIPGKLVLGLAQYQGGTIEFVWSGGQVRAGGALFAKVTGSATYGFGFTALSDVTLGDVIHPAHISADSDNRVIRLTGVFPAAASGGSGAFTMAVDLGSPTDDGVLGAVDDDETSAAPFTAPERTDAMTFSFEEPGEGVISALTVCISGDPVFPDPPVEPATIWQLGEELLVWPVPVTGGGDDV